MCRGDTARNREDGLHVLGFVAFVFYKEAKEQTDAKYGEGRSKEATSLHVMLTCVPATNRLMNLRHTSKR